MWKDDCVIDDIELDSSSLQQPQLHSKYSELLSNKKLDELIAGSRVEIRVN